MKPWLHCKGCKYLEWWDYNHYVAGYRCLYYTYHAIDGVLAGVKYIEDVKICPKKQEKDIKIYNNIDKDK